jgi:hypothetical protein
MKKPKMIIILVVAALFLIVLFQFWEVRAPQIIMIPVTMLIGFALGFAVAKLTGKGRKQGS